MRAHLTTKKIWIRTGIGWNHGSGHDS
jgi:hypothetical protein